MKKKLFYAILAVALITSFVIVSCTPATPQGPSEEDRFYAGMRGYCYYVPYGFIGDKPVYIDEKVCFDIVEEARRQDVYNTKKRITDVEVPTLPPPGTQGN